MPIVNGKAYWASVKSPNTTFDPQWCIDVHLDEDTAKTLKTQGLPVKKKDGDFVLKVKRNVARKDGTENKPPKVVGPDGKTPFSDLIGNGSEVNVKYRTFEWTFKGRAGISCDLVAVQVVNHIPYENDNDDDDDFASYGEDNPIMDDDDNDDPFAD